MANFYDSHPDRFDLAECQSNSKAIDIYQISHFESPYRPSSTFHLFENGYNKCAYFGTFPVGHARSMQLANQNEWINAMTAVKTSSIEVAVHQIFATSDICYLIELSATTHVIKCYIRGLAPIVILDAERSVSVDPGSDHKSIPQFYRIDLKTIQAFGLFWNFRSIRAIHQSAATLTTSTYPVMGAAELLYFGLGRQRHRGHVLWVERK